MLNAVMGIPNTSATTRAGTYWRPAIRMGATMPPSSEVGGKSVMVCKYARGIECEAECMEDYRVDSVIMSKFETREIVCYADVVVKCFAEARLCVTL